MMLGLGLFLTPIPPHENPDPGIIYVTYGGDYVTQDGLYLTYEG